MSKLTCPKCLSGRLVKPQGAFNSPWQPDLVCERCGSPFWWLKGKLVKEVSYAWTGNGDHKG